MSTLARIVPLMFLLVATATSAAVAQQSMRAGRPELYVEVHGEGHAGVPIVVLNGGPGLPHDYMVPEWTRLADRHRVIFYDQRGCGRSDVADDYGWQAHVEDLNGVVDASTQGQVVLAGSSWGATLALLYALKFPQRVAAIVLSGLPPWPDRSLRALPEDPDSIGVGLPNNQVVRVPPRTGDVEAILLRRVSHACPEVRQAVWASMSSVPPPSALAQVAAPVLLIRGVPSDQPDGTVQLRTILPNLRMLTVVNGGHDPWFVAPEVVFPQILTFLGGLQR